MDYLTYDLWPRAKVRLTYFLLAVRYGGKRRIPKEVVMRQMEKSMTRMQENLENALRTMPDDVSEEEKKLLIRAISQAQELERELEKPSADASEK